MKSDSDEISDDVTVIVTGGLAHSDLAGRDSQDCCTR
jgi:hypothetical protein